MAKSKSSATLTDVAALAGVSKMAASVALNPGRSGTRVSAETRQRIKDAAEALGYKPNPIGRMLRNQRTHTIGCLLGHHSFSFREPFLGEVIVGLQDGCDALDYDLLIIRGSHGRRRADIAGGKVDGLVAIAFPGTDLMEFVNGLPIPVVSLADPHPTRPAVTADDLSGGQLVADHLHAKGHRWVLARTDRSGRVSALARVESFEARAAELGMRVTRFPAEDDSQPSEAELNLFRRARQDRPTAVFSYSDGSAWAFGVAVRALGLRIPEDVAVVGFDGQLAPHHEPPLTSVLVPWSEVAERAVHVLHELIEGGDIPPLTVLPVSLQPGGTT